MQKGVEEYKRDIFILKSRLKEDNSYLQQLKQKYSQLDIYEGESYSFSMKIKILQYNLTGMKLKMDTFSKTEAADYYALNYAVLAFIKATQMFSITREMVFRAVDMDTKGEVEWFKLSNFLKDTLKLNSEFSNPIMKALDPQQTGKISTQRYQLFLEAFMIQTEQEKKEFSSLDEANRRVAVQIIHQKVNIDDLWKEKEVNIATMTYGLMNRVKDLDVLDCISCYTKCDPLKKGYLSKQAAVTFLKHAVSDARNFDASSVRLKH